MKLKTNAFTCKALQEGNLALRAGLLPVAAMALMPIVLGATLSIALPAQTFTPVLSFNGIDGSHPLAGLIQGKDGNLYGTTLNGGTSLNPSSGGGTLFKVTPQGAITTLYRFCPSLNPCPDGEFSEAAVVQAKNGDLDGTTSAGGTNTGFMGGGRAQSLVSAQAAR